MISPFELFRWGYLQICALQRPAEILPICSTGQTSRAARAVQKTYTGTSRQLSGFERRSLGGSHWAMYRQWLKYIPCQWRWWSPASKGKLWKWPDTYTLQGILIRQMAAVNYILLVELPHVEVHILYIKVFLKSITVHSAWSSHLHGCSIT